MGRPKIVHCITATTIDRPNVLNRHVVNAANGLSADTAHYRISCIIEAPGIVSENGTVLAVFQRTVSLGPTGNAKRFNAWPTTATTANLAH